MKALRVVLYLGATVQALHANAQRAQIHRSADRRQKISYHRAPSSCSPWEGLRARSCSIGSRAAAPEVLPARDGTDRRFVFRGLDLQSRQTRNDSKLPARNKWRPQRWRIAWLHSYSVLALERWDTSALLVAQLWKLRSSQRKLKTCATSKAVTCHRTPNSSCAARTQTFSSAGSATGATAPGAIPPEGSSRTCGIDSLGFSSGWPNCGCSTRVANSIAVNSNAAAR
jgi:hypothetical protein